MRLCLLPPFTFSDVKGFLPGGENGGARGSGGLDIGEAEIDGVGVRMCIIR